ncbi:hypothetical protein, partial [Enterobacter intestinihominis]
ITCHCWRGFYFGHGAKTGPKIGALTGPFNGFFCVGGPSPYPQKKTRFWGVLLGFWVGVINLFPATYIYG